MTYVLSDIHGNMANFKSILQQIDLQPEDIKEGSPAIYGSMET